MYSVDCGIMDSQAHRLRLFIDGKPSGIRMYFCRLSVQWLEYISLTMWPDSHMIASILEFSS